MSKVWPRYVICMASILLLILMNLRSEINLKTVNIRAFYGVRLEALVSVGSAKASVVALYFDEINDGSFAKFG